MLADEIKKQMLAAMKARDRARVGLRPERGDQHRSVVAGQEEAGVVGQAGRVERVENLPGALVYHDHGDGKGGVNRARHV